MKFILKFGVIGKRVPDSARSQLGQFAVVSGIPLGSSCLQKSSVSFPFVIETEVDSNRLALAAQLISDSMPLMRAPPALVTLVRPFSPRNEN